MLRKKRLIYVVLYIAVFSMVISCTTTTSASITIKPSRSYDFGTVAYGQSASKDFVFSNKSSNSITITSIQITGTNASQFTITAGGNATTIASKATHTITVKFTAIGGSAFAVLRVKYNDANGRPLEIIVELNGYCLSKPKFAINAVGNPPTYDFGMVSSGNAADHTFTITNNGIADLTMSNVTLSLSNYMILSGFTVGTPEIIPQGSTHNLTIRFMPTFSGVANATMAITHSADNEASPFNVNLTGEGKSRTFETNITGTPLTLDYGNVFSGVTKSSSIITITNNGFDNLEISNISVSGTAFTILSGWTGTPVNIGPSPDQLDIVVQFDPPTFSNYNEKITFTHNGGNVASPTDIVLKGVGASNYSVETFPKVPISMTGGTFVQLTDDDFKQVPIGFTFKFYGNNYTNVYVCSNGYIGFGNPTTDYDWVEENFPLPNANTPNNTIMIFASDMDPTLGAIIRYKVEGSAPNRVWILHISGLEDLDHTGIVSGQIRLFETSNIIELRYPSTGAFTWPTSLNYDVLVGLENINGTKGVNYDGILPNPVTTKPASNIRYK